jgi:hypothetical protein
MDRCLDGVGRGVPQVDEDRIRPAGLQVDVLVRARQQRSTEQFEGPVVQLHVDVEIEVELRPLVGIERPGRPSGTPSGLN